MNLPGSLARGPISDTAHRTLAIVNNESTSQVEELVSLADYQSVMLPLLKLAAAHPVLVLRDALPIMSTEFQLTDEDRAAVTSSGRLKMWSRVAWAATYLAQARAVSRPKPGAIAITDRGMKLLETQPKRIDYAMLRQFEEFRQFMDGSKSGSAGTRTSGPSTPAGTRASSSALSPEELIDQGYDDLRSEVEIALLDRLRSSTPEFFEQAVVDLLVAMGFGGSHQDAARRIGKTGDEGVDGVIDEDPLGLDALYIQAKRWKADRTVGIGDVQHFVGSLVGKKASKGVFLTTSSFSPQAVKYLEGIVHRVVLIDGRQVAKLMFEHEIGVRTRHAYKVKSLDESYFEGEL
jgi:restriction system protein